MEHVSLVLICFYIPVVLLEDVIDECGVVTCDWIQFTNLDYALWMHTNYLDHSYGKYVCVVNENLFN